MFIANWSGRRCFSLPYYKRRFSNDYFELRETLLLFRKIVSSKQMVLTKKNAQKLPIGDLGLTKYFRAFFLKIPILITNEKKVKLCCDRVQIVSMGNNQNCYCYCMLYALLLCNPSYFFVANYLIRLIIKVGFNIVLDMVWNKITIT